MPRVLYFTYSMLRQPCAASALYTFNTLTLTTAQYRYIATTTVQNIYITLAVVLHKCWQLSRHFDTSPNRWQTLDFLLEFLYCLTCRDR